MKTDIHPDYQAVVFRDLASGETFLTRSTVTSDKTIELDGVELPGHRRRDLVGVAPVLHGQAAHHGLGRSRREVQPALQELRRHVEQLTRERSRKAPLRRGLSRSGRVRPGHLSAPASRRRVARRGRVGRSADEVLGEARGLRARPGDLPVCSSSAPSPAAVRRTRAASACATRPAAIASARGVVRRRRGRTP